MQAERVRGVGMIIDPVVMATTDRHDVLEHELAARPCRAGDDLVRIEPTAAADRRDEISGAAIAPITPVRGVHDLRTCARGRGALLRPMPDRASPADHRRLDNAYCAPPLSVRAS